MLSYPQKQKKWPYFELSDVSFSHQMMFVLWSDAIAYPLKHICYSTSLHYTTGTSLKFNLNVFFCTIGKLDSRSYVQNRWNTNYLAEIEPPPKLRHSWDRSESPPSIPDSPKLIYNLISLQHPPPWMILISWRTCIWRKTGQTTWRTWRLPSQQR